MMNKKTWRKWNIGDGKQAGDSLRRSKTVKEVHVLIGVSPLLVRSRVALAGAKASETGCRRWRSFSGVTSPLSMCLSPHPDPSLPSSIPESLTSIVGTTWTPDPSPWLHLGLAAGRKPRAVYQRMGSERGQTMTSITALTSYQALASSH